MSKNIFKCGYCGWVINSHCESVKEHDCFKKRIGMMDVNSFKISADDNNILKFVKHNKELNWNEAVEAEEDQSFEELLISAVYARRPLWDFKINVKERSQQKLKDLWQEIYLTLEEKKPVEIIKKRWRQLRDDYTRSKKKQNKYVPSGSGAEQTPKKSTFKYYDLMKFLDDIEYTRSHSNVPPQVLPQTAGVQEPSCSTFLPQTENLDFLPLPENADFLSQPENADFFSPTGSTSASSMPSETYNKKRKRESNTPLHEAILETLKQNPRQQDAVDGFCLMIGEGLRRLPYNKRSRLQIKFMQLLEETENEAD